jgi:hypothetical protein
MTPKSTSTSSTPSIIIRRSRTSVMIRCFSGQPDVVRATPTVTFPPSMSTFLIMFKAMRSRPISGSLTSLRASRMPTSENPSAGSSGSRVRSTRSSAVSPSKVVGSSFGAAASGSLCGCSSLLARLRSQSTTLQPPPASPPGALREPGRGRNPPSLRANVTIRPLDLRWTDAQT